MKRYTKKIGKDIQGLSNKALEEMMAYAWPGNIRELEHTIARSVILCKGKVIQALNLPLNTRQKNIISSKEFTIKIWQEEEKAYLLQVLQYCNGKVNGTGGVAELLDLPASTLNSKMQT